jgi:hypothetical protein
MTDKMKMPVAGMRYFLKDPNNLADNAYVEVIKIENNRAVTFGWPWVKNSVSRSFEEFWEIFDCLENIMKQKSKEIASEPTVKENLTDEEILKNTYLPCRIELGSPWILQEGDIKQREKLKIEKVLKEFLGENHGEKPKSIWKSVKELPIFKSDSNSAYSIIMELKHDNRKIYGIYSWSMEEEAHFYDMEMDEIYQEDISRYCILTDYINYIESFENRIKKLEEK